MKNFARLMFFALLISVLSAVFIYNANAANFINPNTLKVKDYVVFVMDPDENGNLKGDGSGENADNPLKITAHEEFDSEADTPKNYLMTSLYQATSASRLPRPDLPLIPTIRSPRHPQRIPPFIRAFRTFPGTRVTRPSIF